MSEPVVLHRSIGARLFAGFWLQAILTAAVGLWVLLLVIVSRFTPVGAVASAGAGGVPVLLLWLCGVTASARADEHGVRWRYFRRHQHAWTSVDDVRYGSAFVPGAMVGASQPAIFVRAGGVEHPIVPAYGCRPERVREFADSLARLASTSGVPTEADSGHWDRLDALPGVVRSPHRVPGRVVSHSLRRLRIRLSGLAMITVAVLALVGCITGWESHGVGERVVFGIVGVVLGLVGLLLVVVPGD